MRFEHEATPFGVNEGMALASVDLLSSIVAAWPASLGGPDALAVDDRGLGAGVAPDSFAIGHYQRVVYPFKAPGFRVEPHTAGGAAFSVAGVRGRRGRIR